MNDIAWAHVDWNALLRDMDARWAERDNEAALATVRRHAARRRFVQRSTRWLALAVFVALACWATVGRAQASPAVAPHDAARRVPVLYVADFTPPASYARWYQQAERCIGLKGKYKAVRWYITPAPWTDGRWGRTFAMWQPGHRITMNAQGKADSVLVMHEAIHDILARHKEITDTSRHPQPFFDGRCAPEFFPK